MGVTKVRWAVALELGYRLLDAVNNAASIPDWLTLTGLP